MLVREFVELAFLEVGIVIEWKKERLKEKGRDADSGDIIVEIHPRYFRPTEVEILLENNSKARNNIGWKPKVSFSELIMIMIKNDLEINEKELYLKNGGYKIKNYHE